MVDTIRTMAALQALLADNTSGDISPQDVRDFLVSTYNTTETFTPTLTADTPPTLGSGSAQNGLAVITGQLVNAWVWIGFGTSGTNAGSGAYRVGGLPAGLSTMVDYSRIGYGIVYDSSTGNSYMVNVLWNNTSRTEVFMSLYNATSNAFVSHGAPYSWAASDVINIALTYPRADA